MTEDLEPMEEVEEEEEGSDEDESEGSDADDESDEKEDGRWTRGKGMQCQLMSTIWEKGRADIDNNWH